MLEQRKRSERAALRLMLTAVLLLASKPARFEHARAAIMLGLKPELISGNQTRPHPPLYLSEEVSDAAHCHAV